MERADMVSGIVFRYKLNALRKIHRFCKMNGVGSLLFLLHVFTLPEEVVRMQAVLVRPRACFFSLVFNTLG